MIIILTAKFEKNDTTHCQISKEQYNFHLKRKVYFKQNEIGPWCYGDFKAYHVFSMGLMLIFFL